MLKNFAVLAALIVALLTLNSANATREEWREHNARVVHKHGYHTCPGLEKEILKNGTPKEYPSKGSGLGLHRRASDY
jgi:hypothetical protein